MFPGSLGSGDASGGTVAHTESAGREDSSAAKDAADDGMAPASGSRQGAIPHRLRGIARWLDGEHPTRMMEDDI